MKKTRKQNRVLPLLMLSLLLTACAQAGNGEGTNGVTEQTNEVTQEISAEESSAPESSTEEISTEETKETEEPTEPSTAEPTTPEPTEPATEESTTGEPIELPTSVEGETLVPENVAIGSEDWYENLLLPATAFLLNNWYINGAELRGNFYYKHSDWPLVNDFVYTLYTEPSLDADTITVPPLSVLYAEATDRLHWLYLESEDKSICGWLALEYKGGWDYYFVPEEGAEAIRIDAFGCAPVRQGDLNVRYGEVSWTCPLLYEEEDRIKRVKLRNESEIRAYMEENKEILAQEPELLAALEEMLTKGRAISIHYFRDRYANPTGAWVDSFNYDGVFRSALYQFYRSDTVEERPCAYFHISTSPYATNGTEENIMYFPMIDEIW